jgi:hypothetical protein
VAARISLGRPRGLAQERARVRRQAGGLGLAVVRSRATWATSLACSVPSGLIRVGLAVPAPRDLRVPAVRSVLVYSPARAIDPEGADFVPTNRMAGNGLIDPAAGFVPIDRTAGYDQIGQVAVIVLGFVPIALATATVPGFVQIDPATVIVLAEGFVPIVLAAATVPGFAQIDPAAAIGPIDRATGGLIVLTIGGQIGPAIVRVIAIPISTIARTGSISAITRSTTSTTTGTRSSTGPAPTGFARVLGGPTTGTTGAPASATTGITSTGTTIGFATIGGPIVGKTSAVGITVTAGAPTTGAIGGQSLCGAR